MNDDNENKIIVPLGKSLASSTNKQSKRSLGDKKKTRTQVLELGQRDRSATLKGLKGALNILIAS